MPKKWFLIILAIVVIPVAMTSWKIVQYARTSKQQVFELHEHIIRALALNTDTYFKQLNMRLAFAPLLVRAKHWGEQVSVLNNALLSNNDFACVALLGEDGHERAKAFDSKARGFARPLDYNGHPLFETVKQTREADTGSVYEDNGYSFFDLFYPLENGQFLMLSIRWDSLKKILFDQKVGQKGYIWLLDEDGRVIADSGREHLGRNMSSDWDFFTSTLRSKKAWSGEFDDHEQVASVGAADWIPAAGWFVLSGQPQSEAYAQTYALRRQAFFWMIMSLIGVGIFGYFWIHHISRPITRLSQGVAHVARRQFDQKVPENFGLEEFRALGQAFNQMMRELKSYNDLQVEKIIEEQTTSKSLLFNIRDGIVMVNEEGNILFCNEPAKAWTIEVSGRTKVDFAKAWAMLQEYPPWMDLLQPVLSQEKDSASEEFEFPIQGRPRWAKVLAQPVKTESGRRLGVMVVIHDITQDKELDRMKEDFFNGITHDLRTPLAATIGYLGLSELQVPDGQEELGKLVGSARQSAKRALGLVETILSLARLQAGKLNLNRAPVQVKGVLDKIASDLRFHAEAKKITLSTDCTDESLWVHADASMLDRVCENLTGNAIKYTMEGGWVKLSARAVDDGIEISIQDNGRGIPAEALKKLFGKFQQVKAEDRSVGFGIGLAFSKGIIEAHGSTIQVESEVGKGSRFHFTLERTQPSSAKASESGPASAAKAA